MRVHVFVWCMTLLQDDGLLAHGAGVFGGALEPSLQAVGVVLVLARAALEPGQLVVRERNGGVTDGARLNALKLLVQRLLPQLQRIQDGAILRDNAW